MGDPVSGGATGAVPGAEARKAAARKAALARRRAAFGAGDTGRGAARLFRVLEPHAGRTIAGYMPIRTEIDPRPAMARMSETGPVTVPVIVAAGQPLMFRAWTPDCTMTDGPFGARVPVDGAYLRPQVVIVPLVAFTRAGGRLGYGGGFYDRSLQGLRAARPVLAIGFAFAAQEADALPLEPTDQPLDMIVTESEVIDLRR